MFKKGDPHDARSLHGSCTRRCKHDALSVSTFKNMGRSKSQSTGQSPNSSCALRVGHTLSASFGREGKQRLTATESGDTMRRSIHPYRPAVVIELATVLHDVCHTLHHEHDRPVSADLRNVFAKRIVALFDSGVTDLEQLKAHLLCSKP